jgi:outer membrane protein assembly factor BamB
MNRIVLAALTWFCVAPALADWRQFRGTENNPVAPDLKLPTEWDVASGKNIAWRLDLPGRGVSSPIVIGDQIVVTANGWPNKERLYILAFDATSGEELWRRQAWATGRTLCHDTSANAAPSPASDGERIFAFYSSNDLVCLDLEGNPLWFRGMSYDYPKAANDVGMAASPLVVGDTLVIQMENLGDSFAAGLDVATGETRWKIPRKQAMNWCSPAAIHTADGKSAVLLQSGDMLTAHDPKTGEQLWKYEAECAGIASSTTAGNRIYLPAAGLTALEVQSATSAPSVAWESAKLGPGSPSPVVAGDKVYTLSRNGVLNCGAVADGKLLWQHRTYGSNFWATPVIAGGYAYCVNQEGTATVVKLDGKPESVSKTDFGERILGTPAIADGGLIFRSDKHLWKIGAK